MGLFQFFFDAAAATTALAIARRNGAVKFDLTRWPQSSTFKDALKQYLDAGEKIAEFFGRYEIVKKK